MMKRRVMAEAAAEAEKHMMVTEPLPRKSNLIKIEPLDDEFIKNELKEEKFQELSVKVCSRDPIVQYLAAVRLRKLLSSQSPPVNKIIERGLLPNIIRYLLFEDSPTLIYEAAWILTFMTVGPTSHIDALMAENVEIILIDVLRKSEDEQIIEQCALGLANIIAVNSELIDASNRRQIATHLASKVSLGANVSLLRTLSWTMKNLVFIRDPMKPPIDAMKRLLPGYRILVMHLDTEVLIYTLKGLYDVARTGARLVEAILDTDGFLASLSQLLADKSSAVKFFTVRLFAAMCRASLERVQLAVDRRIVAQFVHLLGRPGKDYCRYAIFLLQNLLSGNRSLVRRASELNVLALMKFSLPCGGDEESRREQMQAVCEITQCTDEQTVKRLLRTRAVEKVCKLLLSEDPDYEKIALFALYSLLRVGGPQKRKSIIEKFEEYGAFDCIEKLLIRDERDIRHVAYNIIMDCTVEAE